MHAAAVCHYWNILYRIYYCWSRTKTNIKNQGMMYELDQIEVYLEGVSVSQSVISNVTRLDEYCG